MLNTFSKIIALLIFTSPLLQAQLVPINEDELSDMTGQAFITIDNSSAGGLDFTKVTLGLDVKTLLNSDLLEFGRYERVGELSGGSDIRISDFALGGIDSNGNIVPFEIKDPFVELAFEDNAGRQDLIGVRLGFGGAKGALSGTIESLTGNVNVDIKDTASGLNASGNLLGVLASVLLARTPIETKAQLVDSNGNRDRVRAELIGIANGDTFDILAGTGPFDFLERAALGTINTFFPLTRCVSTSWGLCSHLELIAQNCTALGIGVCFDLKKYNTLDVGKKQNDGTFDFAEGLFLGFQTKPITWKDGTTTTPTETGAFLNVPNGGLEVTLHQAFRGTDRVRTKYVDPYY
jgi:hypothetical protein